jgi:hypothetical protein
MKTVDIQLNQITVEKYDPRRDIFEFLLEYDDGSPRGIRKQTRLGEPEGMAAKVLKQIREDVKQRTRPSFDDSPLGGIINVRFKHADPDLLQERLANFFKTVSNGIKQAKTDKLSYGNMELKIVGIKVLF